MASDSGQTNQPVGTDEDSAGSPSRDRESLPPPPKAPLSAKVSPSPDRVGLSVDSNPSSAPPLISASLSEDTAPVESNFPDPSLEERESEGARESSAAPIVPVKVEDSYSLRGVRGELVGRSEELTEMLRFVNKAMHEKAAGRIVVVGNQGTGKSRLVDELFREIPKDVRVFKCRADRESSSGAVIRALLSQRFAISKSEGKAEACKRVRLEVQQVFGDRSSSEVLHILGRFLGLDFPDSPFLRVLVDNPRQYDEVATSVLNQFLELDAGQGAMLLAVDDLQWADEESLSILNNVGRKLANVPALLVFCAHPDLLVRNPEWGEAADDLLQIKIRNLSEEHATAMFQGMLARCAGLPADIIEDAVEMTGGNPQFLDQLSRLYLANGTIDTSGIVWRLDPDRALDTELPVSVEEVIEARISSLAFEEAVILEMGAVFGNVFWLGAVVALQRLEDHAEGAKAPVSEMGYCWTETDEEVRKKVSQTMEGLVSRDYVLKLDVEDSMVAGDVEYVFKHNLERELIAKGTEVVRLQRYHRLAAQWIETTSMASTDDQLEFLGQLYQRGGDNRRAARSYIAAGDRARARFANEQSAELYRQGLALLDSEDVVLLLDALHNMGAVVDTLGKTKEARDLFNRMLHHAWLLDHRGKGGAAHNRLGRIHRRLGEYDKAMAHLRSAQELFKAVDDKRGIAGTLDDIGQVHWLRGAYGQALSFHRQSLAIRRGIGDLRSIALSLANIGRVHHETGSFKAASRQFREALKIREEIDDQSGVIQSLCDIGRVESADGHHPEAQAKYSDAKKIALKIGDKLALSSIFAGLGECQAAQGNYSDAIASLLEGKSIAHTLGNRPASSDCYRRLAEIHLSGGDLGQASECAKRALAIALEIGARLHIGRAHRVTADVVFAQGRTEEEVKVADEHFRKAVEILAGMKSELELARTYRSYAVLREHAGSTEEAGKLRRRSDEIFGRLRGANRQEADAKQTRVRLGTASDTGE